MRLKKTEEEEEDISIIKESLINKEKEASQQGKPKKQKRVNQDLARSSRSYRSPQRQIIQFSRITRKQRKIQ